MHQSWIRLFAGIALTTYLSVASAVTAPAQTTPAASSEQSGQTSQIPNQKLDAAAAALEKLADVSENYQQRIEAATPAEKQTLLDEAKGQIAKAVTDQGLSIDEYTSILVVAQNDPDVREKILQRIRPSVE
jgi:hypothetical protein